MDMKMCFGITRGNMNSFELWQKQGKQKCHETNKLVEMLPNLVLIPGSLTVIESNRWGIFQCADRKLL